MTIGIVDEQGDGGSSVVHLTIGIVDEQGRMVDEVSYNLTIEIDEQGGLWMKCRTFDYWDTR